MSRPDITLAVVCRGQIKLVSLFQADIKRHRDTAAVKVIPAPNIPEQLPVILKPLPFNINVI